MSSVMQPKANRQGVSTLLGFSNSQNSKAAIGVRQIRMDDSD